MNQYSITSIIDNCDLKTAFNRIITFYDPNRAKNRKTKILDFSSFYAWSEIDYRNFDINKTRKLEGSFLDHRYDIIIFEPPCNKTIFANTIEASKIFTKILNIGGNIIVKIKDFKENNNGNNELLGSYNIRTIFESNDFYLHDQIIYKTKSQYQQHISSNDNNIDHLYFMIFKKKSPN